MENIWSGGQRGRQRFNGFVYCTECKKLLKYNGKSTSNLNRHSCFRAFVSREEVVGSEDIEEELSETSLEPWGRELDSSPSFYEVENKIKTGEYKLVQRPKGISPVWSLYARISKKDGAIIEGLVYCRQCKNVFKYNGTSTSNLNRHKCYLELKQTQPAKRPRFAKIEEEFVTSLTEDSNTVSSTEEETSFGFEMNIIQKNVESKIKSGFYKLTDNRMATSPIWSDFGFISKEDGAILEGLVCCRQCQMVLKYNGKTVDNLNLHKCFTNGPLLTTLDEVKCEEFIDTSAIKEFEDCHANRAVQINEEVAPLQGAIYASLTSAMDFLPTVNPVDESQITVLNAVKAETEDPYSICVKEETAETYSSVVAERHRDSDLGLQSEEMRHAVECKIKTGVYKLQDKQNVRSSIWKMFALIAKEDGTIVEPWVYCRRCKKLLKNNDKSSSNLNRHPCNATNLKKISPEDKQETISACSTWLTEDCRPVSVVEGTGFRKMVNYLTQLGAKYGENLDINHLVPDSTTIAQRIREMAEEKKSQAKLKIEAQLKITTKASVTVDLWPDYTRQRNFLSASLHYSKDVELFDMVLGIKSMDFKQTNGHTIRKKLQNLLVEFGLDNLRNLVFVTDKRADMEKALEDCSRLNCSSFLFAKVLDTSIANTPELSGLVEACKKLTKFYKNTGDPTLVKPHGNTRCNNPYDLFKSMAENWEQVNEILAHEHENLGISNNAVASLQSLVELCQKFEFIFKRLQATRLPSLCFVIPSINRLKDMCEATKNDKPEIANLKSNMLRSLEEIWLGNINIWHKTAFFLYPPANQEQENNSNEIKLFCINQIKEYPAALADPQLPTTSNNVAENGAGAAAPDKDEISFFFPNLRQRSVLPPAESPEEEVERYCRENVRIDENFDVAQWWRHNAKTYPRLSRLALRILAIPASTTGAERILPLAKHITSERRSRLTPKNVDRVVFLNSLGHNEL